MITNSGFNLLNKFLTYDPKRRVTAEEALRHPYFEVLTIYTQGNDYITQDQPTYCNTVYHTRSNYPNILTARTARLLILFPSHFVEYAEFLVSYPFYLTERPRGVTKIH